MAQSTETRTEALQILDGALLRLRHLAARPPFIGARDGDDDDRNQIGPHRGHERRIDAAEALACRAVVELTDAAGGPVSVARIAERLQIKHATASRLLGECVSKGLLLRETGVQDRRQSLLSATPEARQLASTLTTLRLRQLDMLVADWTTEDLATLGALLSRLAEAATTAMPDS